MAENYSTQIPIPQLDRLEGGEKGGGGRGKVYLNEHPFL